MSQNDDQMHNIGYFSGIPSRCAAGAHAANLTCQVTCDGITVSIGTTRVTEPACLNGHEFLQNDPNLNWAINRERHPDNLWLERRM